MSQEDNFKNTRKSRYALGALLLAAAGGVAYYKQPSTDELTNMANG